MKNYIEANSHFIIKFLASLLVAILLPLFIKTPFPLHVMILICIWAIMGMGWNFIGGYAGQVSNGHALFYGIGAYACGIGMKNFNASPWITMWVGVIISIGVAFVLGAPLLRLKGHYFALATMAIAECGRIIFLNWNYVGGATGVDFLNKAEPGWYTLQFTSKYPYYYIFLTFVVLILLLTKGLDKSKFGYYLRAIKANEDSAQSVGINTSRYKLLAFMLSAGVVSLAGSLYANYLQYIDPSIVMPLNVSMMICLVTVMGGIGTVIGPVIGAIVLTVISEYTRATFSSISGFDLFIYGALIIIIVLFLPNGLISLFRRKQKIRILTPLEMEERMR
ncbi:MAG: branched-chain amino acid transporter permease [Herbinix sp.]|jgi:branched-chain amino acid transport system permease protein|nr:branched-chain amino acid transporter permease [Herbinix sp.]